jgi:uncharacterized protein (DUF58 family)
VLAASRAEVPCALELPGVRVPAGTGAAHRQRLLQALALWGEVRDTEEPRA